MVVCERREARARDNVEPALFAAPEITNRAFLNVPAQIFGETGAEGQNLESMMHKTARMMWNR